jgi:hypothetical protein
MKTALLLLACLAGLASAQPSFLPLTAEVEPQLGCGFGDILECTAAILGECHS